MNMSRLTIKPSNINKPRGVRLKKFLMALRVFIGSMAMASYFQESPVLGFWILAAGGLLDAILEFVSDED